MPTRRLVAALGMRLGEGVPFAAAPANAPGVDVAVIGGFEIALALRAGLGPAARIALVAGGPLLAAYSAALRRCAECELVRRGAVVHEDLRRSRGGWLKDRIDRRFVEVSRAA